MNINQFWTTAGEFDVSKVLIWGGLLVTLFIGFYLIFA